MMAAAQKRKALNPDIRGEAADKFAEELNARVIGQPEATAALADMYQVFSAGLRPRGRPVANFLFLGPTGVGKTRCVEALSETLLGTPDGVLKVDCAEFQHSHEIAKLIGSPPGYLGHRETHPYLTQESLDQYHTTKLKLSLVLFDEIEKASDALWQLLLGVMDKATLTLGDNRRVNFSNTVIFLTSNLGARAFQEMVEGGMGFVEARINPSHAQLETTAVEAARRRFSPEFMNRLDKVVVFHSLSEDHLRRIIDIEVGKIQQRFDTPRPLVLTTAAKTAVIAEGKKEGAAKKYGARSLKRTLESILVKPLANLIMTEQLREQSVITIDFSPEDHRFIFYQD